MSSLKNDLRLVAEVRYGRLTVDELDTKIAHMSRNTNECTAIYLLCGLSSSGVGIWFALPFVVVFGVALIAIAAVTFQCGVMTIDVLREMRAAKAGVDA